MKLKALLTSTEYEELNEDLQENYAPGEGDEENYRLTVDGLEEVTGLKSALSKERENFKTANATVTALKDDIVALKAKGADSEELAAAQAKLTAMEKNFTGLTKTLQTVVRDQSISEAIQEHNGFNELGPAYLRDMVKVEVEGDKIAAFVQHGDERMTVSQYTKQLWDAAGDKSHALHTEGLARLFKASGQSGGGTPPNNSANTKPGGGRTIESKPRSQMQTKEKVAFIKKHGEDKFMALPS